MTDQRRAEKKVESKEKTTAYCSAALRACMRV